MGARKSSLAISTILLMVVLLIVFPDRPGGEKLLLIVLDTFIACLVTLYMWYKVEDMQSMKAYIGYSICTVIGLLFSFIGQFSQMNIYGDNWSEYSLTGCGLVAVFYGFSSILRNVIYKFEQKER
ncbi:MAG: hypothetical protein KKF78_01565 [Candidatus Omnitrophica bacterium]|nr:hypothetical protein [Candidatus Omnitrophota bacterium]MBU1995823.1 hypothetical protein [Candidatus Omnitrophota bacterium]